MRFRLPVALALALLAIVIAVRYVQVGRWVPRKRTMHPEATVIRDDVTAEELARIGKGIAEGKGLCFRCHTVGNPAARRFPDLTGIGRWAESRVDGLDGVRYLAQSMYTPGGFIVEGYPPGMPAIDEPPIGLEHREILAVIAYLQSLGGTPTVTLDTTKEELGVE